ncbi:DUF6339 family protein [Gammaproteobacteria bacterium]|nr:DUF6339 family protein [Gammaproteobacteria bacterium]
MSKYFKNKISEHDLEQGFNNLDSFKVLETGVEINFDEFNGYLKSVVNDDSVTIHDYNFSVLMHEAISKSKLDKKFTHDLRFWQWICLNKIKEYCLWRWKIDEEMPKKLNRFLGSGGVTGFSINSASRLYFPANGLLKERDGESLLKDFWSLTQKELSISQSRLSINPKIFIALVKATKGLNTAETNKAIVKLNLLDSNTFLDLMDESDIIRLIS